MCTLPSSYRGREIALPLVDKYNSRTAERFKGRCGGGELEPSQLARRAVEIAADRKAEDIVMLDISKLSIIADYFVICSGTSDRHVKAIAREIDEQLGKEGTKPVNVDGMAEGEWVLLDYGGVLVHVFQPSVRDFYRLEQLWSGAQPVLVVQ